MPVQYENQHVTVFQSELYQTTSTVAVTKDIILITDPTWLPGEIEAIRQHVDKHDNGQRKYLLFTHSDFDHILGWKAFPDAVTIASRGFTAKSGREDILQDIHDFDESYYIQRPYPVEYPSIDIIIDHDEQTMEIGNTSVSFYLAPGHQADGVFAVLPGPGILIAGDYASDVEFPFIHHDSRAYERTLNKLEEVMDENTINLFVPGHGTCTADGAEIRKRIRDSRWYIQTLRDEIRHQQSSEVLGAFVDSYSFSRYLGEEHENNKAQIEKERRA
ncbi:MBL fold metallo-hydrolase [Salibacterium halotolerans]|uniref:Glyoxylase, beta-lactamase superfamily II n=1 Tax=Salibacterium halotolerans TaxID=1884432 RepID=A0A1I5XPG3_9BACI|nr:MBL fold metallo-hydrolase [Salibacterium halotolerans]SFQ33842.1 Glyoxylase, beta-lactamase superfamily II [Salibacterium halotolerans]